MAQLLHVFFWILRLGPIGLGGLAAAIMGIGYYLQVLDNERTANDALAHAAGMPDMVQLADARAAQDRSVIGEVNVQAQLAWEYSYDLWYEENIRTDYVVMFPIIASGASNLDEVLGVAILQAEDDSFTTLSAETVEDWFVAEAKFGPVLNLNGELDDMGKWEGLIEESFYDLGLTMPADPIVIWPYVEGRDVALAPPAPGDLTIFGVFSKIAGVFGLLALGKLVFSSNKSDDTATPQMPAPEAAFDSAPQPSGVPLWKQRSGLVDIMDEMTEPASFEPATFDAPNAAPDAMLTAPQRSGFGVRKVLIGIVACLFVLGLVSTVSDLIAKSSTADTAAVTSIEDIAAATVADVIVPDADPNRHWTDIDVTPVVEWFVAKSLLAAAGDTDAMMTLGMIVGGLFFGLLMIRYFFLIRRSLRPKTSAQFSTMGLN